MIGHSKMKLTLDQKLLSDISAARALFELYGHALRQQPQLLRLHFLYSKAIDATQNLMQKMGVTTACAACAGDGSGSCCFEGIEDGYDHILLLINLLMGCTIPDFREVLGGCFFVGKNGCKLRARYYFCAHYLCPALQTALGPTTKQDLLSAVGRELAVCWELERTLREWHRRKFATVQTILEF
jgi:hypothetical protein